MAENELILSFVTSELLRITTLTLHQSTNC